MNEEQGHTLQDELTCDVYLVSEFWQIIIGLFKRD